MAGRVKVDNAMLHWHWHTLYSTAAVGIEMQEGLLLATYPNEHFHQLIGYCVFGFF